MGRVTASGTGVYVSLAGYVGLTVGFELNVFGEPLSDPTVLSKSKRQGCRYHA